MKYVNRVLDYELTPYILIGVIFLASLILMTVFKTADRQLLELDRAIEIAQEMAKSSDDLTNHARNYVTTRNSAHRDAFNKVLRIRNGEDVNRSTGTKISFRDRVKQVGFEEQELELIFRSEDLSNQLAVLERNAFESVSRGFEMGHNWEVQQHHWGLAQRIMFGPEYERQKAEIMQTIESFKDSVYNRLQSSYNMSMQIAWVLIILINVSLLAMINIVQHLYERIPQDKKINKKTPARTGVIKTKTIITTTKGAKNASIKKPSAASSKRSSSSTPSRVADTRKKSSAVKK